MPNLDGTGPEGKGPQTGQGKGRCGNSGNTPAVGNRSNRGRGFRRNAIRSNGPGLGLRRNQNA